VPGPTINAAAIRAALERRAPVADAVFDRLFAEELRGLSALHWTPVAVALRAAELLAPVAEMCGSSGLRILDVGAGVGKLCLIGALVHDCVWWGVEQDVALVAAANQAAWALGVSERTRFVAGDATRMDWSELDALYFYNPFPMRSLPVDASPFAHHALAQETLGRVAAQLARTRVVTFHGLGCALPAGYVRALREPVGPGGGGGGDDGDVLELWIREVM
jgi:SAM-dependent methyltransferase